MRDLVICVTILVTSVFSAETVILQTDFSGLPPDWFAPDWSFGSSGACTGNTYPSTFWDAVMDTGPDMSTEMIYHIPEGTDSVVITMPYYIHVGLYDGQLHLRARVRYSDTAWYNLWVLNLSGEESLTETDTIKVTPWWFEEDMWIGFLFDAWGECYGGGSLEVTWQVHGLTVTAYGDSLACGNSTWAEIKRAAEI
jgi:hypothetical protein